MTFKEGPILHLWATKAPKNDQRQPKAPKRNHTHQEDISYIYERQRHATEKITQPYDLEN